MTIMEISEKLAAAREELTRDAAIRLLNDALNAALGENDWQYLLLRSRIHSALAQEADTPGDRTRYWEDSLAVLRTATEGRTDYRLAAGFAEVAVDCYQDTLSDMSARDKRIALKQSAQVVTSALTRWPNSPEHGILLARKSSLLRHLALTESTQFAAKSLIDESRRCADRATRYNSMDPSTLLEYGLSIWAAARHATSDRDYKNRLREAEKYLTEESVAQTDSGRLALSRLYRLTFQPFNACRVFPRNLRDRRCLLRHAHILAEAATMLWYAKYPGQDVDGYLGEARELLETTLSAGYRDARTVVALAYVVAICDSSAEGTRTALQEICGGTGIDWQALINLVQSPTTISEQALALGINDSGVWTRLGTLANDFLKDDKLAERLYRTAVKLRGRDAIACTNLARFLSARGEYDEARRLVQRASQFADRRFTWWRAVQDALSKPVSAPAGGRSFGSKSLVDMRTLQLKDLRKRFRTLDEDSDVTPQRRGYELERLVHCMVELTVGVSSASGSYRMPAPGRQQVDGFFMLTYRRDYRYECKWTKHAATRADIATFVDKLDAHNVGGLFISMAGFEDSAIAKAREVANKKVILLADGDDVRCIFELKTHFDEMVIRKQQYFSWKTVSYYKASCS